MSKNSIAELVRPGIYEDNGRRGNPKPGCDCVQCFGYCLVDPEVALHQSFAVSLQVADDEL